MNDLRIVRGTDIGIYADDKSLFGVTSFTASQTVKYHEVYECLSAIPCKRVPQGEGYVIQLQILSLFDGQLPTDRIFTLRVVDGDREYQYEKCRVCGSKTQVKGNHYADVTVTVEADYMRKRGIEDE